MHDRGASGLVGGAKVTGVSVSSNVMERRDITWRGETDQMSGTSTKRHTPTKKSAVEKGGGGKRLLRTLGGWLKGGNTNTRAIPAGPRRVGGDKSILSQRREEAKHQDDETIKKRGLHLFDLGKARCVP